MSRIACPLCRQLLDRQPRTWRCAAGHSFDVAREGYVNLLPVQNRHSAAPGDQPEAVTARREFLQAGYYQPLRDAAVRLLGGAQALLDIGCGEGYYTAAFAQAVPEVIGLDIAKPAVRIAAKRYPGLTWLVGSGAHLPLADASVDAVCSLFTPQHLPEMLRVLAPGGQVLLVTPGPRHLWSLREALFDEVRAHEPEKFLPAYAGHFELAERQDLEFDLTLHQAALRHLLAMTPYVWKARTDRRAALEREAGLNTRAAFCLMRFVRRSVAENADEGTLPA